MGKTGWRFMMEYGHIVISNTKSGFTRSAIRFFTQSKFSHSLITIPAICGQEMGLEAAAIGVSAVPFDSFYRNNGQVSYRVYRFKADPIARDSAIARSLQTLQSGYGYLELAWFIWRGVNKFFGRNIKYQDNWSQAGTICSELCAQYISDCGHVDLFSEFGKGSIHAQDLHEICEENKQLFELIEVKE
jgi:hypothetical protein